jgi:hypothetical protein
MENDNFNEEDYYADPPSEANLGSPDENYEEGEVDLEALEVAHATSEAVLTDVGIINDDILNILTEAIDKISHLLYPGSTNGNFTRTILSIYHLKLEEAFKTYKNCVLERQYKEMKGEELGPEEFHIDPDIEELLRKATQNAEGQNDEEEAASGS